MGNLWAREDDMILEVSDKEQNKRLVTETETRSI